MRVILIEPDPIQARLYVDTLEKAGCVVDHVTSAQAAVHAADEHVPDVVVLEMQLSGHSGVEFLYEFRSYPEWLDVPIVVHTFVPPHELAYGTTLQNELGVRHVLYKPTTTLAELREVVCRVIPSRL